MTENTRLAARYLLAVQDHLGLDAHVDDHGNVVINNGLTFIARLHAQDDPEYFTLLLPIGTTQAGNDTALLHCLANGVNRSCKGVTVEVTDSGQVMIEAHGLVAGTNCLPTAEHLAAILPRAMSMLLYAARRLVTDIELHGIATAMAD